MGNRLKKASVTPASIHSGEWVNVALSYQSDDGGSVTVTATSGFSLETEPKDVKLEPAMDGSASCKVRVTGAPGQCRLNFAFFNTDPEAIVTVK